MYIFYCTVAIFFNILYYSTVLFKYTYMMSMADHSVQCALRYASLDALRAV